METSNIKIVEIVRKIRDRHYKILKGKSDEEKLAFYQEKAKRMRAQAEVRAKEKLAVLQFCFPRRNGGNKRMRKISINILTNSQLL